MKDQSCLLQVSLVRMVRGKGIGAVFEVEGKGEEFWIDLSQQGLKKHYREVEHMAAQKSP